MFYNPPIRSLLLMALLVVPFAAQHRSAVQPTPHTADEAAEIRTLLESYAKANTDFYSAPEVSNIMKFYGPDYIEVSNGQSHSYSEMESEWNGEREQLKLGSPKRRALSIFDVNVRLLAPTIALAILNVTDKVGSGGVQQAMRSGVCTEVLSKATGTWVIQHEHCSYSAASR